MRILVQHSKTALFLTRAGLWVKGRRAASAFENTLEAIRFCYQMNEKDIRILLSFGNRELDIELHPFSTERLSEGNAQVPPLSLRLDSTTR